MRALTRTTKTRRLESRRRRYSVTYFDTWRYNLKGEGDGGAGGEGRMDGEDGRDYNATR